MGESSYSDTSKAWLKVKFLKHRVKVSKMTIQSEACDATDYMSDDYTFKGLFNNIETSYKQNYTKKFTAEDSIHKNVAVDMNIYVNEIMWEFSQSFCIEHIVLEGFVKKDDSKTPIVSKNEKFLI